MDDNQLHLMLFRCAQDFGIKAQEACQAMSGVPMQHLAPEMDHTHSLFQGITVFSHFFGAVQGFFLLSLNSQAALNAFGVDLDSPESQQEFFGFFREVLNTTCAQSLPMLEGEFGELTYSPAMLVQGDVHFPDFATTHLDIQLPNNHLMQCAVFLNLAEVKIGTTLQQTLKALEESSEHAYRDRLTQLFNRHAFDSNYSKRVVKALAAGEPCSLLWIDADHFKEINDTYGHLVGDQALQRIAMAIRTSIRDYDLAFRYGGDEFLVLLPGAGAPQATCAASHIARNLRLNPLSLNSGDTLITIALGMSIGVATMREGDTPESLLLRADKLLYAAKQRGRGCAVADSLPEFQ
jgi:diguanylate cyclase (GGDEF)-like protein